MRTGWTVVMTGAVLASMALGIGCGQPLDNIEVKSAGLSGVTWNGAAMIGGFSETPALLTLVDTADQPHEFDVSIGGPVLGFIFDFGVGDQDDENNELACLFQSSAALTIPEGETVSGSELTGGYFGSKVGMHLVLGIEEHDLENGAGVRLKGGAVNFGVGFFLGFEWLNISVQ